MQPQQNILQHKINTKNYSRFGRLLYDRHSENRMGLF